MATRDAPTVIEMRDLQISFGAKAVLRGLDLDLRRGEVLSLLGPSGCGKSVLLKLIIGLLEPDGGSVRVFGDEVTEMDEPELARLRQRVGIVFQGSALFDSITVGENVAYGLEELHQPAMRREEIRERVHWALDSVGLPGTENLFPGELSGGMRKRAGVARTIALRPEVILYDEPTTGLDPINSARIAHLIKDLQQRLGSTSLVVTHDVALALEISERMAFLDGGRIIASGTVPQMRASGVPLVQAFLHGRIEAVGANVAA